MNKVFVIEKMVAVGFWELMSNAFWTDEKEATLQCLHVIKSMRKIDPGFCARVTKLKTVK